MIPRKTLIAIETLAIEDEGSHIMLKAKVNRKNAWLLIDTGASRTVFDQERIRNYVKDNTFILHDKLSTGLGTSSMQTSAVNIKSLQIGELTIHDFQTVLLDLTHVNIAYEKLGFNPIDGVLGNDILSKYKANISYKKLTLTLSLR